MSNTKLNNAKTGKNDEFYTLYEDVEKEVVYYTAELENKVVYCNCDNPQYSNFYKYFKDNFHNLKLKHLYSTGYNKEGNGYYGEYNGTREIIKPLINNGDFKSEECIEILKKSDVVITNPPFSLFREYIKQLIKYNKQFLIIGNNNAISYKEVFPYIKDNKLWLGVNNNKMLEFVLPEKNKYCTREEIGGGYYGIVGCISWFTNIPHKSINKPLILTKTYNPKEYPQYDNYCAIDVSKVANIPMDYKGIMGVPITFLNKYNPEQFEIIGITENADYIKHLYKPNQSKYDRGYIKGKRKYARILIKKK